MTPDPRTLPRRAVIAASGTAVLAAAAACSSGATTTDSSTPTTSSSPAGPGTAASSAAGPAGSSTASATTAAESSSASAGSSAASSAGSSAGSSAASSAGSGTALATVADVESAGSVIVEGPSGPLLLAAANGSVVAHTAICTHQGCTVAANGGCPCHGSKFNVQTGAVESPPALQPLAEVPVTVSGGQVFAS